MRGTFINSYADNLRYTVDYCVLGFPNATDVEVGGPCATSESCGALEKALKNGIIDPAYSEPYDYCDEDDGVLLSDYMDNCLSCVGASSGHAYLSNCKPLPFPIKSFR